MATLCPHCSHELPHGMNRCPSCTTADPKPAPDPMVGKVVGGRYRLVRRLGRGGMGVVYEAEHVEVGQKVAIKFLHANFSEEPEIVRRFQNEARSYAQIVHPHAVQLHDFARDDDGTLYISMEYIEGCDLKKTLAREGRLSPKDALDVVQQAADVLATAHARGIVHRDLKPENIMVTRELRGYHVKVLDFGLARLADAGGSMTAPGMVCGTPRYMAPEQSQGEVVDQRVDIYSLGLVLFEALTGTHPFESPSISETLRLQRTAPVPHLREAAPDLVGLERVDAAIQKATAKRADDRYATMLDFVRAFSDNLAIAPEDAAATSARMAAATPDAESVDRTVASQPRRALEAAPAPGPKPGPPVASQAATVPTRQPSPEPAPAPAPAKRSPVLYVLIGAGLVAASVGAVRVMKGSGAETAQPGTPAPPPARAALDALYARNGEPPPPERCRETDAARLAKLVAAAPRLEDLLPDGTPAPDLPPLGGSAESAYLLAKAQAKAKASADAAIAAATACAGFAAAENLGGKIAFSADRLDEAETRFRAAVAAAGFAKARHNFALLRIKQERFEEAAELLEEATRLKPDLAESWFVLGHVHAQRSARATAGGNPSFAEAERGQANAAFCRALDLGFAAAGERCKR